MMFRDFEAKMAEVEDALLAAATKVQHPPFKLAYRVGDMLIVRDTEPGDLPQRDVVFNGWRVYQLPYFFIKTHEGVVLSERYATEAEAVEACTQELAERLGVVLAVCSSEEET